MLATSEAGRVEELGKIRRFLPSQRRTHKSIIVPTPRRSITCRRSCKSAFSACRFAPRTRSPPSDEDKGDEGDEGQDSQPGLDGGVLRYAESLRWVDSIMSKGLRTQANGCGAHRLRPVAEVVRDEVDEADGRNSEYFHREGHGQRDMERLVRA